MKTFVIKAPSIGKKTCSLVSQFYDKGLHRTRTRYLGSFNLALDPRVLPIGIRLRPGVELAHAQLEEIRDWLKQHGLFGRQPKLSADVLELARHQLYEQTQSEGVQVSSPCPLDKATAVLNAAATGLENEAAALRAKGLELTPGLLSYVGIEYTNCRNELDRIKVSANRVRVAFSAFEESLKTARLMKRLKKSVKPANAVCVDFEVTKVTA
ncbi:MAG: hypothetical protein AUK51_02695 [Comamonadaceae bacterium CG2_30_59_20]|nr:MAG: hypothetical protein AUK51_02695 [Comamonadaceae bacterium CG2_30_59_20]